MQTADSTEKDEELDEAVTETTATEQPEGETPAAGGEGETTDEVVVTIGDAAPASTEEDEQGKDAPQWIKDTRKAHRDSLARIRELEAENAKLKTPVQGDEAVGEKPSLEGCEYDGAKFEADLLAWNTRKTKADDKAKETAKARETADAAWQAKQAAYETGKTSIKVADFADAEEVAKAALSVTQQGIIVHAAKNPALLVYALGNNPAKLKELAAITDPVQFAFAASDVENQLKVTPKKSVPAPERKVVGNVKTGTSAGDSKLEALRKDAEKTGNYSQVLAYKKTLKSAA